MPKVHRDGDLTTGHDCWPPTIPLTWSINVFANGLGVVRNTQDGIVEHCCQGCHGGTYIGTSSIYVNGTAIQVIGSPVSCGDFAGEGSPDVFAPLGT